MRRERVFFVPELLVGCERVLIRVWELMLIVLMRLDGELFVLIKFERVLIRPLYSEYVILYPLRATRAR